MESVPWVTTTPTAPSSTRSPAQATTAVRSAEVTEALGLVTTVVAAISATSSSRGTAATRSCASRVGVTPRPVSDVIAIVPPSAATPIRGVPIPRASPALSGCAVHHAVMTPPAETPFALVDRAKVERNVTRLGEHLRSLGVAQRPRVKSSKALEPTQMVHGGIGPITVSTLAEAEFFADAGYTDILYAVGIAPGKLDRVARLRRRGVDLTILLDTVAQA